MKYEEIPKWLRNIIGYYQILADFGYRQNDMEFLLDQEGRVSICLREGKKEVYIVCGKTQKPREEAELLIRTAFEAVKDRSMPDDVILRCKRETWGYKNDVIFITGLVSRGFSFPALKQSVQINAVGSHAAQGSNWKKAN